MKETKNQEPVIKIQNLKDLLSTGDLTENEKMEIKAEIQRHRLEKEKKKTEELKAELEKERLILAGMKEKNLGVVQVKEQEKKVNTLKVLVSAQLFKKTLPLPESIYSLLYTEDCLKRQKVWLFWYCHNGGNIVESCEKSGILYREYRSWMNLTGVPENDCFREAKEDVDSAFLDAAEAIMKELINGGSEALTKFYLQKRHPNYADDSKKRKMAKTVPVKQGKDWSGESITEKQKAFISQMGL